MYDATKQSVNALLFSVFKDHLYHEISKHISHQTLLVTLLSIKQSFFISANLSEKSLFVFTRVIAFDLLLDVSRALLISTKFTRHAKHIP